MATRVAPLDGGGTVEIKATCAGPNVLFDMAFFDDADKPLDKEGSLARSFSERGEETEFLGGEHTNELGTAYSASQLTSVHRLEVQLAGGRKPVVDLRPSDSGLRQLYQRCSGAQEAKAPSADILRTWESEEDSCSGGAGDDPATTAACQRRDRAVDQLNAKGWCYGKDGQSNAEYEWHRCGPGSIGFKGT